MSLGPRGADRLPKKLELNEAEAQSGNPPATHFMNMVESDQVNYYFRASMRKYEHEKACKNTGRSASHQPEPEIYITYTDMALVRLRPSRSHDYGRQHRDKEIRDYRRWQQQGKQIVVDSLTKRFGCMP